MAVPDPFALTLPEALRQATELYRGGDWPRAARLCGSILNAQSSHFEALNLLGIIAAQTGRLAEGADLLQRAVAAQPGNSAAHLNYGNALMALGRFEAALLSYERVLQLRPDSAEASINLGLAQYALGHFDAALDSYQRALQLRPDSAEVHYNRGLAFFRVKRFEAALDSYERALQLKPDYAAAYSNRGVVQRELKRPEAALDSYQRALRLQPDCAETFNNRGNVERELGLFEAALASYQRALRLKPDFAEAYNNRCIAQYELKDLEAALDSCGRALQLRPDYAEAHCSRGIVLFDLGRFAAALESYERALHLNPEYTEAYMNRGVALHELGQWQGALASFEQAIGLKPDYAEAHWSMAMSQLPPVAAAGVDPAERRAAFATALAGLDEFLSAPHADTDVQVVGVQQPFYLAYQEENNRELMRRYGALCARLMDDWLQRRRLDYARSASPGTIRLGIASSHLREHSVWHALIRGWLQHLDRGQFQLHLFHLGPVRDNDEETAFAARNATTFSQAAGGLQRWVETIQAQHLDILLYPEVGMDKMTCRLASMRLAPVQIATWGHPETTGLPSIDYYVSAEDLEPRNAGANYTERLIQLPNLGCCYPVTSVTPVEPDFQDLAIDPTLPLLICPGVPFKYAPEHDWVLVEIARQLGRCQFIFFKFQGIALSEILHDRLRAVFTRAGLGYDDRVVLIPWQPKPRFYGLMRRADVYLDTIGFSGFNTAMQAVECGLPIATREGRFMRGRFASAILRRMGLSELVARTETEYVALVVRLATDADFRQRVRSRIQKSRDVLFDDLAPVRALEEFLRGVAAR